MKKTLITLLIQIIPIISFAQIEFFTNFDSGAIGEVIQKEENKYQIQTKIDPTNPASPKLEPSRRWFYFLMTGVKDKKIELDIFYNDSKRPVYSYDNINYIRFTEEEVPENNKTITKKYQQDSVWIAYFVPYNNNRLTEKIEQWIKVPNTKQFNIGETEDGREMRMLVITNNNHNGLIPNNNGEFAYTKNDRKKKVIYIHGRVHPSETPSSWQLEGIIDYLTSNDSLAVDLRNNTIFYILPFANPDGVADGMSRSNSHGINLEVNWDNPEETTAKEVKNIRRFLRNLKSSQIIPTAFLNMHSQIAPHITYWIHDAESTSNAYYKNLMLLANLTTLNNPYFGKEQLSFSKIAPRYLEGWMYDNFNKQTLATTFETTYSYYNKEEQGIWVTPENLKEQGINTINAISDLFSLSTLNRIAIDEPKRALRFSTQRDNNYFYFGESYLISKKDGARLKYKFLLPKGEYIIYKWNIGQNKRISEENENIWEEIGEFNQERTKKTKYIIYNNKKNQKLDRILFVKKEKRLIDRTKIYVQ